MNKWSVNLISAVLIVACVGGLVAYFRYHPFHWYLLIGPGIGSILVLVAARRQERFAREKAERESQNSPNPN
jgi:peptidoglycan/LPS O-acetylase OafA/YrhL